MEVALLFLLCFEVNTWFQDDILEISFVSQTPWAGDIIVSLHMVSLIWQWWQVKTSSERRSSYRNRHFYIPLTEFSTVISVCPRINWHQTFSSSLFFHSCIIWRIGKFTWKLFFFLSLSLSHIHTNTQYMIILPYPWNNKENGEDCVSMKQKRMPLLTATHS